MATMAYSKGGSLLAVGGCQAERWGGQQPAAARCSLFAVAKPNVGVGNSEQRAASSASVIVSIVKNVRNSGRPKD
jgi:hypothetical protein